MKPLLVLLAILLTSVGCSGEASHSIATSVPSTPISSSKVSTTTVHTPIPSRPATTAVPVPTSALSKAEPSIPTTAAQTKVSRVVDGDTIDVEIPGQGIKRVRYIGVNTPETVDPRRPIEFFGKEASAKNKELVEGKTVYLEKDVSETDRYDRLLRYIYLPDGAFVNLELVKQGYAQASSYPPDVKYPGLFNRSSVGRSGSGPHRDQDAFSRNAVNTYSSA